MLEVKEIHAFYGRSHVLQGVSLSIQEGEVVCLLGRNGAGKTTTLRSIMGLTPPRSGSVKFKGMEIRGKPPFQICRLGIGYVPQDRRIFPDLTVEDNLEVAKRVTGRKGWTKEAVYQLFPDLEKLKSHRGSNLSGGEQQMLAIARSLMVDPELLLLDEPSEGLAPMIVKRLERLIKEITSKGIAVLLAEQNMRFAMSLANRGYIIDKGRIRHEGDMEKLREDEEIIGKYLAV